ncbi:MAG TPA: hypothetical protein VHD33_00145 [Legionellaceae bacterium]|nr:hypothetical protein [Legionellaceae bacterium]
MKKLILIAFLLLGYTTCSLAQSINLKEILRQVYSKPADLPVIKGEEIDYIVPPHLEFIDTSKAIQAKLPFDLLYLKDLKSFEGHLKKVHNVTILSVDYNVLYGNALEITLEITKTKDSQYFGRYKFFTFIDKRRIKLVYDKENGTWSYNRLIKLWEEPQSGHD